MFFEFLAGCERRYKKCHSRLSLYARRGNGAAIYVLNFEFCSIRQKQILLIKIS